jgi:integrase
MDALREQYEGGFKMSAYKDKTQGTWYVSFRYIDWTGKKIQKLKRGFKTKKEALNYEKEFIRKTAADMKMEMNSFIQVYFEDKKNELKENSIRNKQHMLNKHIVPYFGTRKMNEITPAEIIQWQNTIQEKGYSKTYERMIQNQLNALFNHAQKIYNLKENPCKKVKKMGKSDANKLEFWTKAEYDRFIAGIEPGSEDYLIFEILFWTGIREGDDDDKIRLNQRKPSKYKGLSRFGPEKNLQRINKFMKERPIFYKNLIQMKENFRFYLRCFYCITKVVILQFNSENRTELARNG